MHPKDRTPGTAEVESDEAGGRVIGWGRARWRSRSDSTSELVGTLLLTRPLPDLVGSQSHHSHTTSCPSGQGVVVLLLIKISRRLTTMARVLRVKRSSYRAAIRAPLLAEIARLEKLVDELRAQIQFVVPANAQPTSKAIVKKVRAGTLPDQILQLFYSRDWIDDEIERHLNRAHQSVSAARRLLVRKGWLEDSGKRRKTQYNNNAIVWRLKP